VLRKVYYTVPWRTIFHDKTGTLTGKGPDTYFCHYWKHNDWPECETLEAAGGMACDNTVQIRRIAFWGMPDNFYGMRMKVL